MGALGFEPRDELLREITEANIPVYPVGDCVEPRNIHDAIREGFLAACQI